MRCLDTYQMKKTFKIAGDLELEVDVRENEFGIPLEALFSTAARRNKKRGFLFVSKVIGKHTPVHPQIPRLGGHVLAHLFMKEVEKKSVHGTELLVKAICDWEFIPEAVSIIEASNFVPSEPTLFIGFAETATGLGHAMFSAFSEGAAFIHTTRDNLKELRSVFDFEEEHSHATTHFCYTLEQNFFEKFSRIVLVDDEATTGKTSLNLIQALNSKYPGKKYVIASLLDWRTDEHISAYEKLENELGIKIDTISLVRGIIKHKGSVEQIVLEEKAEVARQFQGVEAENISIFSKNTHSFTFINGSGSEKNFIYLNETGRFGIYSQNNTDIDLLVSKAASKLIGTRTGGKCLCLGFGEYIYIPAMIASKMGDNIYYHSTTRSPVYPINEEDYAVKTAIQFDNPYDNEVENFIYNILPDQYEEVYIFLEIDIETRKKENIVKALAGFGIKYVRFVVFS